MAKKAGQTKGQAQPKLTDKDEADIKRIFKLFCNENDKITEKDLKLGLRVVKNGNPTEKEIDQIYEDLHIKRGDEIDYNKFHKMMVNHIQRSENKTAKEKETDMLEAFKVFDKNKDNLIDKAELKHFLTTTGDLLSDKEAEEMFKLVDANKDGKIDSKEFAKLFCSNIK